MRCNFEEICTNNEIGSLDDVELNVLRYVSGACIHNVTKDMRLSVERKLLGNLHKAKVLYRTHKFLNSLWKPEAFMLDNSAHPETLMEIVRRQGYKRCLTIISDDVFHFFKLLYVKLKCVQTLQHIKQNPKNVLQSTVEKLEFDKQLSEAFCNLFSS